MGPAVKTDSQRLAKKSAMSTEVICHEVCEFGDFVARACGLYVRWCLLLGLLAGQWREIEEQSSPCNVAEVKAIRSAASRGGLKRF